LQGQYARVPGPNCVLCDALLLRSCNLWRYGECRSANILDRADLDTVKLRRFCSAH